MDERVMQFRVGVVVLATLIITVILAMLFGEGPVLFHGTYTVYVVFPQAPGVTENTPVRKSGVLIGRVTSVELLDEGGVRVTCKIDAGVRLFQNETCRISSQLLGDTTLEFYYTGPGPNRPNAQGAVILPAAQGVQTPQPGLGKPIEPGAVVQGQPSPDPMAVIADMQRNLATAVGSVSRTSDHMDEVVTRLNGLLAGNEQRLNSIIAQTDQTLGILRTTLESANSMIGDPQVQAQFRKAVTDAPRLLADAREAVVQMRASFRSFDQNMQNLEQFTRPLGEHGGSMVKRFDHAIQDLDTLVGEVVKFGQSLNSSNGTLGQLINNPELYNNLNRTVSRLDEVSQELRPILNDARVFSDKIARHPEMLGVRGALERRPGIK
jgi:phospholipid/cholesterol/gamma-HCH transport system substrate-binding protein